MPEAGNRSVGNGAPARSLGELLARADRHHGEGRLEEAERCYRDALALRPGLPEVLNNLGSVYLRLGRYADAEKTFRATLASRADFAEAQYNLAVSLRHTGRLEEAAQGFRRALELRPELAEAHNDLGNVYRLLGRAAESEASYRRAIALRPEFAEAHHGLATLVLSAGRADEAEQGLRRALALRPDLPGAHSNLGIALVRLGRHEEAEQSYRRALALVPNDVRALHNLSLLRLLLGDYEAGFELFEHRFEGGSTEQFGDYRKFLGNFGSLPRWRGEPLQGKGVLVLFEQGLGDNLMVMRYLPLLKQRGASRIAVVCPPELIPLMQTIPEVERAQSQGVVPTGGIGWHCPIMSLPFLFRTRLETIPRQVPYLHPSEALVRQWSERLAALAGLRIGIVWQGSLKNPRERSLPFESFGALARIPGVRLVSLQKGAGSERLNDARERFPVEDFSAELDVASGPFMDTSAIMRNLDLVITSDNALAHLAGALGVEVWVGLPFVAEWRWLLERTDSPWYPTMRLFRQKKPGDWEGVFQDFEEALRRRLSRG